MKSEEEKKTRQLRTRMTQNQYKQVKEKADEQNMTVSAYVVEAAVHSSHYHMHIMLNSVNLKNGGLFHSGPAEIHAFADYVMRITGQPYKLVFEQR